MVISGRSGDEDVFKALELGAVDFIAKPTARATPELANIEQELIRKVHAIRELRIDKVRDRAAVAPTVPAAGLVTGADAQHVVVVASSTGGPAALMEIFGAFREAPACSFLVAQHMPAGFTRGFAERLDRLTSLRAREAEGGEELQTGSVLVAPGGFHLELETVAARIVTRVRSTDPADKYSPSADRLFRSAAKHCGARVLSVVLTGMGDDGRHGVEAIKAAGGSVIAESESTAVIFGMPQQAIRTGVVDRVLPLGEIASEVQRGMSRDGSWNVSARDRS
jgi:two-component system chemotaxis response regulator CheB